MPPRKSTDSAATVGDDSTTSRVSKLQQQNGQLGVEDLGLPKTMITRLAKGVLPANTQIQKDAILAICKSATVFVNYLASSANDRAVLANKKTIQPKDVLDALPELEFEAFRSRCDAELEKYNAIQTAKRNDYRKRVKEEKGGTSGQEGREHNGGDSSFTDGDSQVLNGYGRMRDSSPATKKARTSLAGESRSNGHGMEEDDDGDDTIDDNEDEDAEEDIDEEGEEEEDAEEGEEEDAEEEYEEVDDEDRFDEPEDPLGYQDGPRRLEEDEASDSE